jgi:VIT1/CCC1 family predicted Fe2+/Mn2+ transporter
LSPEDERTESMVPALVGAIRRLRQRVEPFDPHVRHPEPRGNFKSGALRAAIFGVNDGLVSNLSLIMGVTGAGASNRVILLAGIAGLLAGAFSMGAGEYISMRVQREVFERLLQFEAHELATTPEAELHELAELFRRKGISTELALQVAKELSLDPDVALETHAREELGLDPQEGLGSPWGAALASFATFCFGAFVPLLPFLLAGGGGAALASAVLSGVALFGVGGAASTLTARPLLFAGLRQLGIGAAAAAVTYGVGSLFHVNAVG